MVLRKVPVKAVELARLLISAAAHAEAIRRCSRRAASAEAWSCTTAIRGTATITLVLLTHIGLDTVVIPRDATALSDEGGIGTTCTTLFLTLTRVVDARVRF